MIRKEIFDKTAFGIEVKEKVALGEDLPQELVLKLIKQKLDECLEKKSFFIIDGFPRTFSSYNMLKDYFSKSNITKKDVTVIILDIPDEAIIERIKNRMVCPNFYLFYIMFPFPPN